MKQNPRRSVSWRLGVPVGTKSLSSPQGH